MNMTIVRPARVCEHGSLDYILLLHHNICHSALRTASLVYDRAGDIIPQFNTDFEKSRKTGLFDHILGVEKIMASRGWHISGVPRQYLFLQQSRIRFPCTTTNLRATSPRWVKPQSTGEAIRPPLQRYNLIFFDFTSITCWEILKKTQPWGDFLVKKNFFPQNQPICLHKCNEQKNEISPQTSKNENFVRISHMTTTHHLPQNDPVTPDFQKSRKTMLLHRKMKFVTSRPEN